MNTPPEWLLSFFMQSLQILSILTFLEIIVIVTFAILTGFWLRRAKTTRLGKNTMKVNLILTGIVAINFFYPHLATNALTLNIIGRFILPALFYTIAVWWAVSAYKNRMQ